MLQKLLHQSTNISLTSSAAPQNNKKIKYKQNFKILDRIAGFFVNTENDAHLFALTRLPLSIGIIVISLFFGIFASWSFFAPIKSAVVATGQVIPSLNKQIIQHLEGGVIEKILVLEGDDVQQGQLLIRLKSVSAKSQQTILNDNLYNWQIEESRLIAERDDQDQFYLHNANNVNPSGMIDHQRRLFALHKKNLKNKISLFDSKIKQSKKEIESTIAQLSSERTQMELVEEELANKKALSVSGSISRPVLIALEKQRAMIIARIAREEATMARINQQIDSIALEKLDVINVFQNDVITELKNVQSNISDTKEKLFTIDDILYRTEIKAPQSGVVTNLKHHTVGGVISPGAKIMEIIPSNDDLFVEVKVSPVDIDAALYARNNMVTIDGITGSITQIRIASLNSKKTGLLKGLMTNISADSINDSQNPNAQYYLAQIKIPASQLKSNSGQPITLHPGMPVTAFIATESKTLFSYLLSPILSTFNTAFRER